MKRQLVWFFVIFCLSACNLGATPSENSEIFPTKTLPSDVVSTADASSELSPVTPLGVTDVPLSTTPSANATITIACQARTEWQVYTIQRGDNLSRIAQAVNSTIEELTIANCLDNPNRLNVGQTLYVPNLPSTATPSPTAPSITATKETRG